MDCRQCRENISAYIDGVLDGSLISEMQQHLSECPRCRKEYTAILKVREMCAGLKDVELPSGFCSYLIDRLKGEESAGMLRKIRWRVNRRVVAGVAAAVVLVFGMALVMSGLGGGGGAYEREMATKDAAPPLYDAAQRTADYPADSTEEAGYQSYDSASNSMAPDAKWAADSAGAGVKGEMEPEVAERAQDKADESAALSDSQWASEQNKLAVQISGFAQASAGAQAGVERKIIRSAYLSMETTEFDRTVDEIIGRVNVYLGYIESSEIQGKPTYQGQVSNRKAHFEIRVPSKSFDSFIGDMVELGNVTSRQIRGEDITGQYLDVEARLKSLRLQEERLLTLLSKAEKLQDIIELERELSRVRYEIENYTGTLKQWDNMVQYSRVSVDVYEVRQIKKEEPEPITWGDRIVNGFIKSWERLGQLFADLAVFIVSAVPYLVVLAVMVGVLWSIAKRSKTALRPKIEKRVDKIEEDGSANHEQ
ncbi:DUF4349 domain-containing protein [Caldicoprobacter algeriensis]|uniref:DUF4349 domain-containing protein n=1 Tax=Caldicoprobacter algeriensis TaxID=699281 RepID=UPI00207AA515|nr:DUF4349 domain-containing protein [Caldicoprobacter algeriensis]MCM8901699.1 DUF4349 domain-containing protein [Caldicoprobacter algeriensis]